jgi:group I intron endonuclease
MITYIATNTINGKFYIGSTTDFEKRKRQHLNSKKSLPFQNALRAHPEAFEWETHTDESDKRILEEALLEMFFGSDQCYNINPNPNPPDRTGVPHTEKTREKNRLASTGENNPMYGRKRPDISLQNSQRVGEKHPWFGRNYHADNFIQKLKNDRKGEGNPSFGKKWWINENGDTLYQREDPGESWKNGRVWR